jgi:glutamate---methylamine ligase
MDAMVTDLAKTLKERGIKYVLFCYADLAGTPRSKLVPREVVPDMVKAGAGFAGFATWLNMTPADPDLFAIPDVNTLIQLPWKPEVGWMAADPWMNGAPVDHGPRNVLKRVIADAASLGYEVKIGVECEFFLLSPDGVAISDPADSQDKPCYDQQALMRRYDVISEICDAMRALGWEPYQNDHEDANGQFEMNWLYDEALTTADRHLFFKYMVKSIAERHGLRATFMPKPFEHLTGTGTHMHVSAWSARDGKNNLFLDQKGALGLSALAYEFIGGVIHSAPAMCAITNPTVNSYKRLNAPVTTSGATWSPNTISYSGNNRTHMIRIPEAGRFELRLPDGATNPYLAQSAVIAAGMDGIRNKRDPGKRLDINMYTEGHKLKSVKSLPLNLLDATRSFEKSDVFASAFGDDFMSAYAKQKYAEWNGFSRYLTDWERTQTLDC